MNNVLILGGGVGGTLVANLISRKIKKQIDAGEAKVTVVDETGEHVYQPGFMYIAMGNQNPRSLRKLERRLLDDRVRLIIGEVSAIAEATKTVTLADGTALDYDELVLATGARILPESIENFEQEAHQTQGVGSKDLSAAVDDGDGSWPAGHLEDGLKGGGDGHWQVSPDPHGM